MPPSVRAWKQDGLKDALASVPNEQLLKVIWGGIVIW